VKVTILSEHGYREAMLGLSLSYNQPVGKMERVSTRLCGKGGGHDKFLRFISVYLDITASRAWWQQMATYSVGVSVQSESTMHTITRGMLTSDNFYGDVDPSIIDIVNLKILEGDMLGAKANLPESFLQRRIVVTNYAALRNIIKQRAKHKYPEWQEFCVAVLDGLFYRNFIDDLWEVL